jgi:hypothetical protein
MLGVGDVRRPGALRAFLDAQEHLALHDEVGNLPRNGSAPPVLGHSRELAKTRGTRYDRGMIETTLPLAPAEYCPATAHPRAGSPARAGFFQLLPSPFVRPAPGSAATAGIAVGTQAGRPARTPRGVPFSDRLVGPARCVGDAVLLLSRIGGGDT